ncbi:MAG: hypothetical protein GY793_05855 [Proteobacteria bacterium]|nr:hypothetical protein [Pseudomonadota bacterium]
MIKLFAKNVVFLLLILLSVINISHALKPTDLLSKESIEGLKAVGKELEKPIYTDEKQKAEIQKEILATVILKDRFTIMHLKKPCKEELETLCKDKHPINCLDDNRDKLKAKCKRSVEFELGGAPSKDAFTIQGVTFPKGSRKMNRGKTIKVSKNFEYNDITFKTGYVSLRPKGYNGISTARLAFPQVINEVKYNGNDLITFNKNNKVISAELAKRVSINGVNYYWSVKFYDNGQVKSGFLKLDTVINNIPYKAKSAIIFYSDGQVKSSILAQNSKIHGLNYKAESSISFHSDGSIYKGTLAADTKIHGLNYKADSKITFEAEGEVYSGTLATNSTIYGVKITSGSYICFYNINTLIISNRSKEDEIININGANFFLKHTVEVWKNGNIKKGRVATKSIIHEKEYPPRTIVEFYRDGRLSYALQYKDPPKPLKAGDKVKTSNYMLALSGGNFSAPEKIYKGKPTLQIESIGRRLSTINYPTKNINVDHVILPQTEFTIVDVKVESMTVSDIILKNSKGVLYNIMIFNNKIFKSIKSCSGWCAIFKKCDKNPKQLCTFDVKFNLRDEQGQYVFDRKKKAMYKYPYSSKVIDASSKALQEYAAKENIKMKLDDRDLSAKLNVDINQLGYIFFNFYNFNINAKL